MTHAPRRTAISCNCLIGRDAPAAIDCTHGQVIDVEFTPHPLELVELIRDETAYDFVACHGHDCNDVLLREKPLQICVTWLAAVSLLLTKGTGKQCVEFAELQDVGAMKAANDDR